MKPYSLQDAALRDTQALPNGAAATVSDYFDLELTARSHLVAECELQIEAPALGATPLPDAKTMTYSIECDDNSSFSSARVIADKVIVQTGAGGAGAAAQTKRFRLPSDCERYLRVKATGSASGDASSATFTVSLGF